MPENAALRSGGSVMGRSKSSGRFSLLVALPREMFEIRVLSLFRTCFSVEVASLLRLDSVSRDVFTIFLRAPLVFVATLSVIDSVRSFEEAPILLRI